MVTMEAHRYGYPGKVGEVKCPHCGLKMQRHAEEGYQAISRQCLNPQCPYLQNKETYMPVVTATEHTYEVIPTGEYLAQVTDVTPEAGTYGPQFKFTLEIVKPKQFAGKTRGIWTSQKLGGGKMPTKLWQLTEAAYNRPLVFGEQVDVDDLVGKQLIIAILAELKDGMERSNVKSFKAYKNAPVEPAWNGAAKDETAFAVGEAPAAEADDDDPFNSE